MRATLSIVLVFEIPLSPMLHVLLKVFCAGVCLCHFGTAVGVETSAAATCSINVTGDKAGSETFDAISAASVHCVGDRAVPLLTSSALLPFASSFTGTPFKL